MHTVLLKLASSLNLHGKFIVQLFSKLECDEMEIIEHTQELLEELGPEEAMASEEIEGGGGGGEEGEEKDQDEELEDGLEDSDSEQLEEDREQAETDNMDLS